MYKGLVAKPEGKRPFGRTRHRCEDDIQLDLKEWDRRAWPGLI
jgi:hypothetical protein